MWSHKLRYFINQFSKQKKSSRTDEVRQGTCRSKYVTKSSKTLSRVSSNNKIIIITCQSVRAALRCLISKCSSSPTLELSYSYKEYKWVHFRLDKGQGKLLFLKMMKARSSGVKNDAVAGKSTRTVKEWVRLWSQLNLISEHTEECQ